MTCRFIDTSVAADLLDALPDAMLHDVFSRLDFETRHEAGAAERLSLQHHLNCCTSMRLLM